MAIRKDRAVRIAALLVAALLPLGLLAQPSSGGVTATLELNQDFYYAGDPFLVRLLIGNSGEKKVKNPIKGAVLESFQVETVDGKKLERRGSAPEQEPVRPGELGPNTFYGTIVDLTRLFPGLAERGQYRVRWAADGVESQVVTVRMLPKYDPAKSYSAVIKTQEGTIVIDLLGGIAPIAVKSFIDMANADFYDGLLIHEVRPDQLVAAGDPQYGEGPRMPFVYPAEQTKQPVVAGTVVMKPVQPAPPANGSQFLIMLRPEPMLAGQVTVFGRVVQGLDLVRTYSRRESNGASVRPFFKPVNDIRILDVEIRVKPDAPPAGSSN